jgi:hypothetical protein
VVAPGVTALSGICSPPHSGWCFIELFGGLLLATPSSRFESWKGTVAPKCFRVVTRSIHVSVIIEPQY